MSDVDVVDWLVTLRCVELLIERLMLLLLLDMINYSLFWNTDFSSSCSWSGVYTIVVHSNVLTFMQRYYELKYRMIFTCAQ